MLVHKQHLAPTFESRQLLAAAGMQPNPDDKRPHVVLIAAESEYIGTLHSGGQTGDCSEAFQHLLRNAIRWAARGENPTGANP